MVKNNFRKSTKLLTIKSCAVDIVQKWLQYFEAIKTNDQLAKNTKIKRSNCLHVVSETYTVHTINIQIVTMLIYQFLCFVLFVSYRFL